MFAVFTMESVVKIVVTEVVKRVVGNATSDVYKRVVGNSISGEVKKSEKLDEEQIEKLIEDILERKQAA